MAKYISNRQQNLKIGIVSYTEDKTVLEVTGNVGIKTADTQGCELYVNGDVNISSNVTAQNYYGSGANLTGISTFANANIASGIFSNIYVSGISTLGITSATHLTAQSLVVSGISTLAGKIVSGNGIGNTNISNTLNYSSSFGINAFRPISLVDSAAGIKISRNAGQTSGAALELQTWDVGIVTNYSYWDVNAENGYFGIRDRKNSRSRIFIDDSGSILLGANSANFSNNYAELVGVGTDKVLNVLGNSYISGSVGIGTTNSTSKLHVVGDVNVSGVVTATTFVGALTGIAVSATQLVTPKTFQITGDVVSSPVSFDGTGNVSLAATIQPNSVGLGTDTTGDYVRDITGTVNQISVSATSGEGSTPILSVPNQFTAPQDVTVTRDLLVSRNLNVDGNITIGGTSATLFTTELKISDPDIVLGFRTDGNGNDISNDNTANHGGVALASTEGTPLVDLFIAGIETNPATYKKIMWFKSGTFAGLGTDAWLINYAVGIGSTQFPTGTRLAAGNVQFTQNDLAAVRNINSSGIVTATTFVGALTGTATSTTNIPNLTGAITSNNTTTSLGSFSSANLATALTDKTGSGANVFATSPTLVTPVLGAASATSINVSGIATINQLDVNQLSPDGSNYGTVLYVPVANGSGGWNWATVASAGAGNLNGIDIREEGTIVGTAGSATSIDFRGNNIIATGTAGGAIATVRVSDTPTFDSLVVSSGSTFTNGPILVGTGTSTGTASQRLQVTGGAYVSGSVGIGTTNPQAQLHITGQFQSTKANSTTSGEGQIFLNGATGNRIDFNNNGVAAPAFTTRSAGTKIVLNSAVGGSTVDYALGIEGSTLWYSVASSAQQHRWYAGTTQLADLKGTGEFLLGTTTPTGTASQPLQVTGGAYVSGSVGIGTTNPRAILNVVPTATSIAGLFSGTTSSDMVRITQLGTGNALVVEDSANPDASPFVVKGDGSVGIGTTNPVSPLQVVGVGSTGGIRIGTLDFFPFSSGNPGSGSPTFRNSSPNSQTILRVIPNGTGTSQFEFFGKDYYADINAWDNFRVFATGTSYRIDTSFGTTGTIRPIVLETGVNSAGISTNPNQLFLSTNGNIGIGTSIPTSRLHVIGDGNFTGVVTASSFSGNASSATYADNAGIATFATTAGVSTSVIGGIGSITQLSVSGITTTGTLNVGTGGTIITTTSGGLVGINTTNPLSTLDVRGTISIGRTDHSTVNSIRSVTDINSWEYGGVSLFVGGQESNPHDIYFKDDGTKMFILGSIGDDVNEYALSTAWEVNTATFTTVFSVASQETAPLGLYFKPDGTRMYICGQTAVSPAGDDQVRSYTLSTPWSIASGVTYDSKAYTVSDTAPQGVYLKDDGLKMYVVGSTGDAVYEYSLSIEWELDSTITLLNTLLIGTTNTLNLPLTLTGPTGIDFNPSGTKMYITDINRDVVARFDLATPWDTTTTTFYDNLYVGFQELEPTGVFYQEDQYKAYIVGATADTVFQYNTEVPSLELASAGISTRSSVIINNETRLNNRLYVTGDTHISSNTNIKGTLVVDGTVTVPALNVNSTLTAAGAVTASTTTGAINLGTSQTTGTLILGGTSQTGAITLGRSTATHTINIDSGAIVSGGTKTINLGTGGASGSRTLITVGSATAGAASTVFIPSPTNLLIGTGTSTGTASQPLQVTGGAYVSGSVGIGTTNPTSKLTVQGDVNVSGVVTATTFVGALTGTATSTTNIPNLTGAIISVNTTTSLGSFTSAQLATALSDKTGTGSVVFATSPTLVTPSLGAASATSINSSGIVTATQFVTGASGSAIGINTNTISGPATITIDPAAVGDNTGLVVIKGDLQIDGTTTTINSTTVTVDDKNIVLGSGAINDAAADGSGITIESGNGNKTFQFEDTGDNLGSSENINVASGKVYKINNTSVLSSTTLGSGVVNSSLTSVGTLGQLQVTGVSTFTNGSVLIGSGTSTGTVDQRLQVSGGAYVSGNLGIGRTNSGVYALDVNGVARIGSASAGKISVGTGMAAGEFGLQILPYSNRTELQAEQQGTSYRPLILQPFGSDVGIGTTNPSAVLDVRGNPWFSPNTTGVKATALRLGRFVDGVNAAFDIITDDNTGDAIEIQSNRFTGTLSFSRSSPSGIQTTFTLTSNYLTGTSISIADTTGTATKIKLDEAGNTYFNNTGAVLVGTISSTGTASQPLQVTGGAYVSGSVGIGTTNPISPLEVSQDTTGTHDLTITNSNIGNNITKASRIRFRLTDSIGTKKDVAYITAYTYNLDSSAGNYLSFFTRTVDATPTEKMRLDKDGNLVLGSSFTPTGTASQPLQVNGGAYVSGNVGVGVTNPTAYKVHVAGDIKSTQALHFGTGGTYEAGTIYSDANFGAIIRANTTSPVVADFLFTNSADVQRFRIDTSGNVIIPGNTTATGTTSQRLQVTGGAYFAGVGFGTGSIGVGITNPQGTIDIRTSPQWSSFNYGANLIIGGSRNNGIGILDSTNSNPWAIVNNSANLIFAQMPALGNTTSGASEAARITSNRNLLIGAITETGTASQRLQVTGGAYVSGNLGIGGTNPTSKLQVHGDGRFVSSGQGDVTITHSSLVSTIRGTSTVQLALGANNNEVIRINNSGFVGIGTINPVATLQVKDALAFETTNTTTSSTSQVAVDTFATATFRSAKYQVQMTCPGQLAILGGITTGGSGYTTGIFNVTFTNSSGTGAAAQGTLTISNGTVSQIGVGTTGGSGYTAGDVLTAAGGSGLQVSVASTASPSGRILTLGAITSAGIGYTSGVGVGTTTLAFLGGTGTGAVGLATIFDGVITSSTLLQQPTTGTGGTVFYSGSNYTTGSVLTIAKSDVTNTITNITGSVGVSTFTALTAHGIGVSDAVRVLSTSNGLTVGTNYFVVTTPSATTFTLGSSVGIGTTFTTGSSLSIGFHRNSANAGGSVSYLNAITSVSTNFQVSDLLVLQNGTTTDFVEYATIANNDILGTFSADISGANARLLVTPTYATNTVKVARQAITV